MHVPPTSGGRDRMLESEAQGGEWAGSGRADGWLLLLLWLLFVAVASSSAVLQSES